MKKCFLSILAASALWPAAPSLRDGDVIVAVDGQNAPMTEAEFIAHVRLKHAPGETLGLTLWRGGRREDISMAVE